MRRFHEVLRDLRISRGITQEEIANAVGVAKSTMAKYDRGEREPTFATLIAIAKFFNVTTDYLLGITETKTSVNDTLLRKIGFNDSAITFLQSLRGVSVLNDLLTSPSFAGMILIISIANSIEVEKIDNIDILNISYEDKETICTLYNSKYMTISDENGVFIYNSSSVIIPEQLTSDNIQSYYIIAKDFAHDISVKSVHLQSVLSKLICEMLPSPNVKYSLKKFFI